MVSGISSSLAGMNWAFDSIGVRANNLANINTESFKSLIPTTDSGPNGQPKLTVKKDTSPGPITDIRGGKPVEGSNTDLTAEMVGLTADTAKAKFNAKVIQTQNEMTGTIINIKA
ncbi:MAG: hypothetical protein HQK59_07580 [Deltaproteobacteria bacterium]|nr:hypothetical protein [Deltaproteobacteria bacterium]MBF0526543.1 hypothetical protein [Deltaproteobacteria bacterium]